MNRSSKNIMNPSDEFGDFFSAPPDVNEKAWGLIHDFYHALITYMGKNNISRSDLATRMNKSRSAISQLFNKTPNITLKKMVEIADALDQNLKLNFETKNSVMEEIDGRAVKASFVGVESLDNSAPIDATNNVIPFRRANGDNRLPVADAAAA